MDLDSQPKPETELMSLVTQGISLFNSTDWEAQPKLLSQLKTLLSEKISLLDSVDFASEAEAKWDSTFMSIYRETYKLEPKPELISLINQICSLFNSRGTNAEPDWDFLLRFAETWRLESEGLEPELKLISLLSEIISVGTPVLEFLYTASELEMGLDMQSKILSCMSLTGQLVSLATSMDWDLLPKPQIKVMSLITQMFSVAKSITDSDPEWQFITLATQLIPLLSSLDVRQDLPDGIMLLFNQTISHVCSMGPDSELYLLIGEILCVLNSIDLDTEPEEEWELEQLISLSPQLEVQLVQGKFQVTEKVERMNKEYGKCHPKNREKYYSARGEDATHFHCKDCNGEDHEECEKTPAEVKHPLHPKHHLQLVVQKSSGIQTRMCFCCDDDLRRMFYYCSACDHGMNMACVEKPPILAIDHPKWHEHTLHLFPRRAFLTCNVCALSDASSPIYMCPPCDFVVHLRCINLPRVIRISRHPHRISFTPSFDQGESTCGVCRKEIDNDYGGYSCIKDDCLYAVHSRCATQMNVWDGIELDGVPEDIEEDEVEPFVQISDGIIQHFSHQHHLRLDENTRRDYDDNKQCQACITPIYFGNFYSCMECDFILHEECASFSRKIHHPIHPHLLTLVEGYDRVRKYEDKCSACPWSCRAGFFYECGKEGCYFKLHVQCGTISEPLVHQSHVRPLFLTSKPGEERTCSVCKDSRFECTNETFNCIECDFALCFGCATLPQKAKYKHDRHMLTLFYGKETSTMTYWCEVCEEKVDSKKRFFKCDEYCCVTLHMECLIGKDLYMKLGSSCIDKAGRKVVVLPNNHMSRPFCFTCRKRCPYNIVLNLLQIKFCSIFCIDN